MILSGENEDGEIPLLTELDAAFIEGGYFTQKRQDGSDRHLSLSSLLALNIFNKDGQYSSELAATLNIESSDAIQKVLSDKPYGDISELQTVAIDVALQTCCQIFTETVEPEIEFFQQQSQKPSQEGSFFKELAESYTALAIKLYKDLQAVIARYITFDKTSQGNQNTSTKLSAYSRLQLQDGFSQLAQTEDKTMVILTSDPEKQSHLDLTRVQQLFSTIEQPVHIINLESLSDQDAINYFKPDRYGNVPASKTIVPNIISSELVEVVDRIHVYQLKLANGKSITVSHLPVAKGQVVEMTANEYQHFTKLKDLSNQKVLHGGYGSDTLAQVAFSVCPALQKKQNEALSSLILGSNVGEIDGQAKTKAAKGLEKINPAITFLWEQVLQTEIAKANLQPSDKALQQYSQALQALLDSLESLDKPSIEKLKATENLLPPLSEMNSIDDLIQFFFKLAEADPQLLYSNQVEELFELLAQPIDGEQQGNIRTLEDLNNLFEISNPSYQILYMAHCCQALSKLLDEGKPNGSQLIKEIPLALVKSCHKLDAHFVEGIHKGGSQLIVNLSAACLKKAVLALEKKLVGKPTKAVKIAGDYLSYVKDTSTGIVYLLEDDRKHVLEKYATAHDFYNKLLASLNASLEEKRIPKNWLADVEISESEKMLDDIAPQALEPFVKFVESKQGEKSFKPEEVKEARRILTSSMQAMKRSIVAKALHAKDLMHGGVSRFSAFEKEVSDYVIQQFSKAVHSQSVKEKLLDEKRETALDIAVLSNNRRNKDINANVETIFYAFKKAVLSQAHPVRIYDSESESGLSEWATDAPIKNAILLDPAARVKFETLDRLAQQYQKEASVEGRAAIAKNYNSFLINVLFAVEAEMGRKQRHEELTAIFPYGDVFSHGSSLEARGVLKDIREKLPKIILLDAQVLLKDKSGNISDPLFIEWLTMANAAGAKLVLVNNGTNKDEQINQLWQSLHLNGVSITRIIKAQQSSNDEQQKEKVANVIEELLNDWPEQIERKECLFICKKQHLGIAETLNIQEAGIEASDVESKINVHDRQLHQLANAYGFNERHNDFFLGKSDERPLTNLFGFKVDGFKNNPLAKLISIQTMADRLPMWVAGSNPVRMAKGDIEQDKKAIQDFFAKRGMANFTEDRQAFSDKELLDLLRFPVLDPELFFEIRKNKEFLSAYIPVVRNGIFSGTPIQTDNVVFFKIMAQVYQNYKALSEVEKTSLVLEEYFANEIFKAHGDISQEKTSQDNLAAVAKRSEKLTDNFIVAALEYHDVILEDSPAMAQENEQFVVELIGRRSQKILSQLKHPSKLKELSSKEQKDFYQELKQILNLMEVYLEQNTTHNRDEVLLIYNQLATYHKIYYLEDCDTLLEGDDLRAELLKNYKEIISTVWLGDSQPAILEAKKKVIAPFQQEMCCDFDIAYRHDRDHEFMSLLRNHEIDDAYSTKAFKVIKQLKSTTGRITLYDQYINQHDLAGAYDLLENCIKLISKSIKQSSPLVKVVLENWDHAWGVDFQNNLTKIIYREIYNLLESCEDQFIKAKFDPKVSKPQREMIEYLEQLLSLYHKRCGSSLLELRMARLREFHLLNPKHMQVRVDKWLGVTCEQSRETLFLRKYFNEVSLEDLQRQANPFMTKLAKEDSMVVRQLQDIKQKFDQQFIVPYARILAADAERCFDFKMPKVGSIEEMLHVFCHKAVDRLTELQEQDGLQLEAYNKINEFMARVNKYFVLYNQYERADKQFDKTLNFLPEIANRAKQKAAHKFLLAFKQQIEIKTTQRIWKFSFFERYLWGSQVDIELDGKVYQIPKAVNEQYQRICDFLNPKDSQQELDFAEFKAKELAQGDEVGHQLCSSRAREYFGFFSQAGLDMRGMTELTSISAYQR